MARPSASGSNGSGTGADPSGLLANASIGRILDVMYEEILALAAELREATDHLKRTMDRFATIGSDWLDVADGQLKRQDFAGLVQLYQDHSEIPYGLDQPYLWHLPVELSGGGTTEYGELFRRLGRLLDEQSMMDASV